MTKPNTTKIAINLLVILTSICLLLLISSKRVLVWETKVEPGEVYILPEWGDLGKSQQAQLVCHYFTGRSIKLSVYWYSPNGIMGKDQCPFILSENAL